MLYWPGTVVSPCGAASAVKGPHRMAIDAYILPFPDGVMGFVDADPARLRVRGGRVTLALYGPAEATAADQAALRARLIEALGSIIRSEGGYAAVFWPRLWWTVGGLLSLVFLILVALPSGLPSSGSPSWSQCWRYRAASGRSCVAGGHAGCCGGCVACTMSRSFPAGAGPPQIAWRPCGPSPAGCAARPWTCSTSWKATVSRPGGPARRDCTATTVYGWSKAQP